ncbi:hypothetical protein [Aeromonas rivipollensis]|uniref:hypothetical protein n=1 Tax=Aeromonas rivipollensis TaxID=948519 RepID=UPI0027D95081|nr:hypothetical protein [uncultured Aeromonas sp.]MDU1141737.1 hypothetical protein [Aeromonas hydrophila]
MFEHIKKRIIKELVEEVVCLDASGIEIVGHNYISVRENQTLVHHGLNKDYMPSGYTVDTFSDDSSIVGEYSAEKGYFDYSGDSNNPEYKKIEKDILHALAHKKPNGPDTIYLVSNQEEQPSFRSNFNSTQLAKNYGDRLIIIDARELAKGIYNQSIQNPHAADFYKQFFPTFSQNMDNYEYFGKLPNICSEHVKEEAFLNAIARHYESGRKVCVLHGLSGSGKTQSVIDFVRRNINEFSSYIWITGEDWKGDTSLSSVKRTRGGAPVNVVGLFNTQKTILVVDNFTRTLDISVFHELEPGFQRGGVVLVTSQISEPRNSIYLPMPIMSMESAFEILGESEGSASNLCKEFVSKCRFSPLILSMTRKLSFEHGVDKEGIYSEILKDPELVDDTSGVSIVRKILGSLEAKNLYALKKIANSGKSYHDIDFLRYFIGQINCSSLQKLSILFPENTPGVLRVHDLIALAVQEKTDITELVSSVESYISLKKGDMTPSVLRQIHLCAEILQKEHIRRGSREIDWVHYSLLQLEGNKKLDIHNELHDLKINSSSSLPKIKCVIDAKEAYSYQIEDNVQRHEYYEKCIELYSALLGESISEDIRLELLHHKGKALRRSGKSLESLRVFQSLLILKPEWHATYGQISHLGTQSGVEKEVKAAGEKSMRDLLAFIKQDSFIVPLRVSLAALARLRSYSNISKEINNEEEFVKKLADVISMAALEGLGQFYEAFVSFTSMFSYRHSEICINIAETLPEMVAIPPGQVEMRQWISACEALTNSSVAAKREGKEGLSNLLIEVAMNFADEISNKKIISSYEARCLAKTYNIGNKPERSLSVVERVVGGDINHWLLYEQAKACLILGEDYADLALKIAKECFELAEADQKASGRISIYHNLLSCCYEKLEHIDLAIAELTMAINKCSDSKYEAELKIKLDGLRTIA